MKLKGFKWRHRPAERNSANDAAKLNERTDADDIVTFFRELLQNLVDAEKGEDHLVEINLDFIKDITIPDLLLR